MTIALTEPMNVTVPDAASEHEVLSAFRRGSQDAAELIYVRYKKRVARLLRKTMGQPLLRRHEPEDLMQWIFTHTFNRIREAHETAEISNRLWPLMAAIAGNVVKQHARFWRAQRRDVDRTTSLGEYAPEASTGSPDVLVAIKDVMQSLLLSYPTKQRMILKLLMMRCTVAEIVERADCSERMVYRVRKSAERVLRQHLIEHDSSAD